MEWQNYVPTSLQSENISNLILQALQSGVSLQINQSVRPKFHCPEIFPFKCNKKNTHTREGVNERLPAALSLAGPLKDALLPFFPAVK